MPKINGTVVWATVIVPLPEMGTVIGVVVVSGIEYVEIPVVDPLDGTSTSERTLGVFVMVVVFFPQTAPNVMDQKSRGELRAF